MVTIGSARISENGTIQGQKGDQNGKECSRQNWYLSTKGWYLLRPANPMDADKIAKTMEQICDGNVGYSQPDRYDLFNKAKQVGFDVLKLGNTPCNVDCSEAIRVCLASANIYVNSFTTASEVSVINATGQFDVLTSDIYCKMQDFLKRGDILTTRSKGHTVCVLTDGVKHNSMLYPQLQRGDKGYHVKKLQKLLKYKGFYNGSLDGDMGIITTQSLIAYQGASNGKLVKDGICGKNTWSSLVG